MRLIFLLLLLMPLTTHADDAATQSFHTSDQKMMAGMAVKPTGDPDKDFVAMMLPHHQGAIDMAKTELRYGKDPELRALARSIIAAQDKEIRQMQEWQRKH